MSSKASSGAAAEKAPLIKRKRTAAKKILARYSKVRRAKESKAKKSNRKIFCYYPHFKISGIPKKIFRYIDGKWVRFPDDILGSIKEELERKDPAIEVEMGGHQHVLDFIHMYRLDLRTGDMTPMAWTDETDHYFFPSVTGELEHFTKKPGCHCRLNLRLEVTDKGQRQSAVAAAAEMEVVGENPG